MKSIEIDEDLYAFIASQTKHIGESASEILRRLLLPDDGELAIPSSGAPESNSIDEVANETESADAVKPSPAPVAKKKVQTQSSAQVTADAPEHNKDDIESMVSDDALSTFTKRVDQFLFILSAAHKLNTNNFGAVESIVGKNRTYFAKSKEALLENGSSTNPKAIPDSPFWVVTNNNTAKKVNMIEQVLRALGYQPSVVETIVSRFAPEGK